MDLQLGRSSTRSSSKSIPIWEDEDADKVGAVGESGDHGDGHIAGGDAETFGEEHGTVTIRVKGGGWFTDSFVEEEEVDEAGVSRDGEADADAKTAVEEKFDDAANEEEEEEGEGEEEDDDGIGVDVLSGVYEDDDEEEDDVLPSIEQGQEETAMTLYGAEQQDLDRSFSTTTALHLEDHLEDPFVEYDDPPNNSGEDEEEEDPISLHVLEKSNLHQHNDFDLESRKVSDSFSTMPEEMEIRPLRLPEAPLPPKVGERSHNQHRSSASQDGLRHSTPFRDRFASSPRSDYRISSSASRKDRFVGSPLARQGSSGFRHPSSVRDMQLSSPSPPPGQMSGSARSARQQRYLTADVSLGASRNGTPSRGQLRKDSFSTRGETPTPPSKHPNSKKEYPLILLHCSFSYIPLPYSPAVLRAVLPPWIHENLSLLREKLGPTVFDRGVLIPHPGEDYELLEERILESLELKTPRVGKCGHFLGSGVDDGTDGGEEDNALPGVNGELSSKETETTRSEAGKHIENKCDTCGRNISKGHEGCTGDGGKKWDIRVYASNGLMRAGAWSAAWREMEKVDLEIGIWIPENIRAALELESLADFERERTQGITQDGLPYLDSVAEDEVFTAKQRSGHDPATRTGASSGRPRSENTPASTAACSRPQSRQQSYRHQDGKYQRQPLSTLLLNYLKRNLASRDMLFQVVILVLAFLLFKQWQSPATVWKVPSTDSGSITLSAQSVPIETMPPANAQLQISLDEARVVENVVNPDSEPAKVSQVYVNSIPACTFTAGAEAQAGMTALPSQLAEKVLLTVQTETFSNIQETNAPIPPLRKQDNPEQEQQSTEIPNGDIPLEYNEPTMETASGLRDTPLEVA